MKKYVWISLTIIIIYFLCSSYYDVFLSYKEESKLQVEELEELQEELQYEYDYLEDENEYLTDSIKEIFEYYKNAQPISPLSFQDLWKVQDCFDFSFRYDTKEKEIFYDINTVENDSFFFINGSSKTQYGLQFLFVGLLRSDGLFTLSESCIVEKNFAFSLPDKNYSYEAYVLAKRNNQTYFTTYKFSCDDIKESK